MQSVSADLLKIAFSSPRSRSKSPDLDPGNNGYPRSNDEILNELLKDPAILKSKTLKPLDLCATKLSVDTPPDSPKLSPKLSPSSGRSPRRLQPPSGSSKMTPNLEACFQHSGSPRQASRSVRRSPSPNRRDCDEFDDFNTASLPDLVATHYTPRGNFSSPRHTNKLKKNNEDYTDSQVDTYVISVRIDVKK